MRSLADAQHRLDDIQYSLALEIENVRQQYFEQMRPLLERRNKFFRETPNFWLLVFQAHPVVKTFVRDENTQKVMSHLIDISFVDLPSPADGFKMIFVSLLHPLLLTSFLGVFRKSIFQQ